MKLLGTTLSKYVSIYVFRDSLHTVIVLELGFWYMKKKKKMEMIFQVICSVCNEEQQVWLGCWAEYCNLMYVDFPLIECLKWICEIFLLCIFPGCSGLFQLWCQHGGIFLRYLQILWWWCNYTISFNSLVI